MPRNQAQASARFTIVPDTNVWAYLVDADALEELRMATKRHGVGIVACPAVVYEGLRLPDPRERAKRATALAMRSWIRTMPEAYLESLELRGEVGRLRPDWLIRHPDPVRVQKYRRNERDWRGDFWTRVRRRPDDMARWIGGKERLDVARDHAKRVRREALASDATFETLDLGSREVRYTLAGGPWGSDEVERWRVLAARSWEQDLIVSPLETFGDWLLPWLDPSRMWSDAQSLTQFWREVATENMPRAWIRWAMAEVQAHRKVTAGTPGDNQIATYLPDFDLFVTSDKALAECVHAIRPVAPVPVADAVVLPAGADAVRTLLSLVSQRGT